MADESLPAIEAEPVQFSVQAGGGGSDLPGPLVSPALDGTDKRHTNTMAGSRRFIGSLL